MATVIILAALGAIICSQWEQQIQRSNARLQQTADERQEQELEEGMLNELRKAALIPSFSRFR